MRNLSAAELVSAWERTQDQPPALQALALLSLAVPERPADELAGLSIGQRDAHLLALRERLFGPRLSGVAVCPQCHQSIELAFSVTDVRADAAAASPDEPAGAMTVARDGYRVRFHLPSSMDLASLDPASTTDEAQTYLLARCIESVILEDAGGREGEPAGLPAAIVAAVAECMSAADPQADTRLALSCPECHHDWRVVFDIATYLAAELDAWASHLLREVDRLARTYGWREADILAMTPARRRAYLELAGSN